MEIVAADIGGTHARFAIAEIGAGRVTLGQPHTFRTADHAGLGEAWAAFAAALGRPLPRAAGIAMACPVRGETLKLTNSHWSISRSGLAGDLGLDKFILLNDLGAVAHAVAQVHAADFRHLCGPDRPIADTGIVSVIGPGTGLGTAQLVRKGGGTCFIESEGGHIGFAPLDAIDDAIVARVRGQGGRVLAERVAAGPGLANIYAVLSGEDWPGDGASLWTAALAGDDRRAVAALARYCGSFGAIAGDIALAHGAEAVVIAGGLGLRLADVLPGSDFGACFAAKGQYAAMMAATPVKLMIHPQPGLLGAAAALAKEMA